MILKKELLKNGVFTLPSELLGGETPFYAVFPKSNDYFSAEFPILYLLHGLFGRFDNWLTHTKLIEYAEKHSFAIVCAEGGDSWYADSPQLENHYYESYFLDELIPFVEEKYNVGKSRKMRAVAGLSMGGYGAFKFAFRRPEMFCFAASMSGAFHAAEIFNDNFWAELQPSISTVFGENKSLRTENDLFQIIERCPENKLAELPFFYFDCGTEDGFLPINRRLAEAFKRRGIAHKFKVCSGGHDWNYWDTHLKNLLLTTEKFLEKGRQ